MIKNLKKENGLDIYLEITHRCNKKCSFCCNLINQSNFEYLKKHEFTRITDTLSDYKINKFILSGGEPLCHPLLPDLVENIESYLQPKNLMMITNGKLLDTYPNHFLNKFNMIVISQYPGYNNKMISKYKERKNVKIKPYIGKYNPKNDCNFTNNIAKKIFDSCPIKDFSRLEIVGDRIYQCCIAERIERERENEMNIHIKINENWENKYNEIETWRACRYCHNAKFVYTELKYGKIFREIHKRYRLIKNEMNIEKNNEINSLSTVLKNTFKVYLNKNKYKP